MSWCNPDFGVPGDVQPDTIIPPFSIIGGSPGRQVGESHMALLPVHLRSRYLVYSTAFWPWHLVCDQPCHRRPSTSLDTPSHEPGHSSQARAVRQDRGEEARRGRQENGGAADLSVGLEPSGEGGKACRCCASARQL